MKSVGQIEAMRRAARRAITLPRFASRVLFGAPTELDGNTLDAQTHALLALFAKLPQRPFYNGTPEQARRSFASMMLLSDKLERPAPRVIDRFYESAGHKQRVRVIYPDTDPRPKPAVVYFHGGGYVVGSVDTVDPACHRIAFATGAIVVNVDYRLAPDHKMPCAAEDCFEAFKWVVAHAEELGIDATRIAVAGDSAGGGLSAVLCQLARDAGGPMPAFQLLIYPVTDTRMTRSRELFREGFLLDLPTMDWFIGHYAPPERHGDFRCAPLRRPDLSGLPPAHVITAGFDPLRDEGEAYAKRLREAGNRVTHVCEKSLIHGFVTMDLVDEGNRAFARMCEVLRRELFA